MSSLADQVVDRALADRHQAYASEVRQLIDAAYRVTAETGHLDPPVRKILAEAGLSNPTFYRLFRSKDELLLVMLDEGRARLVDYLAHRTAAVEGTDEAAADERVAEWVRGVLAQVRDGDAARRTRPFVVDVERLHARFPEQQAASEQQIVAQLADVLGTRRAWAETVYALVFAELARHLRADRQPSDRDIENVVSFVLGGIGAPRIR
ncbi:MAG: TetR/AcrR family transcriptional regulator [Microthrixaceae bacterium]